MTYCTVPVASFWNLRTFVETNERSQSNKLIGNWEESFQAILYCCYNLSWDGMEDRHRPYEINAMMLETAHEDTTIELDAHGPGGRRRGQKNNHLKFNNIAAQCADMNAFGCVYYGNEISLSRKYPIKGLFLN